MTDCSHCIPRLKAIRRGRIFPCPEAHADYFPIGIVEEYFCRHHVLWLLVWYEMLAEGKYPPQQSGYRAQPGYGANLSQTAPFERGTQLYTQLSDRLTRTREDGQTLLDEVEAGLKLEQLSRTALRALSYIAGRDTRLESYSQWKADKNRGDVKLVKPCEKCGNNRWRTVKKDNKWRCRKCGNERRS